MDRNFRLATQIAEAATSEDLPVILAGDFNAPAQGKVARLFASKFQDAHLNAGGGFGFTFPGVTRNPLSLLALGCALTISTPTNGFVQLVAKLRLSEPRSIVLLLLGLTFMDSSI